MRQYHTFTGPDGDFHYIDWGGSGPLAHFGHAIGFCAGVYTPLADRLRPYMRVLGMDARGHGKTGAPADPRRLKNWDIFAEDLERFFEHLDEPVIAMGHSLGGFSSMLAGINRPELVRALVLIDPTIFPFSRMWLWFLVKKAGLAGRLFRLAARAARRKGVWPDQETILAAYRGKGPFRGWKDGFLEAYIAYGTEETGQGTIRLCCKPAWESRCFATYSHDVWRYVPRLQLPTLVLYGAQSNAFQAPAVKRFRAKVPSAAVQCFEGTSHFVPMERPHDCAEAIFTFLRENKII